MKTTQTKLEKLTDQLNAYIEAGNWVMAEILKLQIAKGNEKTN